ncbi:TELO2-interacting protein 2 isoform X4 [Takifugu rubripes]|uniref:TELO2-interacting protein 2 isoform X4 n=1 Tax=Takifugu rubripes TaxID=31033 RepID=UPI001145E790|nr:TELO2-interacting protein 2 isoform X4 [Takifugu rubripes]
MGLSSLFDDLQLSSSSETPLSSQTLPPITEFLAELQKKLLNMLSYSETLHLIGHVANLFQTADPDWLFSPSSGLAELQVEYNAVVKALVRVAALPLCEDDYGSLPAATYQSIPYQAVTVCSALTALLETLGNRGVQTGIPLTIAPSVLVFAVTHFQDQPWTNSVSRAAARNLQEVLLRAGGWRDSGHLLTGENNGVLGKILDILQPQMTQTMWQRCEAVKFVYVWIVLQPAAELRQWNTAEVVYEALFKHLYTTDAAVIQPILWCLLDLLLVLEKPPCTPNPSSSPRKPCRHDDVLRLMLTNMEAEHKVALRRVYASALPLYVDRMGVAICRHMRRLDRVVLGYLEVRDPSEERSRLKVLRALQNMIRFAWPRMTSRADVVLRSLLKFLLDVSSDSDLDDSLKQRLMSEATLCITLMDCCCHGNLQSLLQQVEGSSCSSDVLRCLATVTGPIRESRAAVSYEDTNTNSFTGGCCVSSTTSEKRSADRAVGPKDGAVFQMTFSLGPSSPLQADHPVLIEMRNSSRKHISSICSCTWEEKYSKASKTKKPNQCWFNAEVPKLWAASTFGLAPEQYQRCILIIFFFIYVYSYLTFLNLSLMESLSRNV